MNPDMQNPGVQAGASRNQLGSWLQNPITASEAIAQIFAARFCVSKPIAHEMAYLCFGDGRHD